MSLSVWLLYKHGEHRQLVEKSIDPHDYEREDSPWWASTVRTAEPMPRRERFQRDYAAVKFLSKCVGLKTGINVDEVAIDTAHKAELRCRETNLEIRKRRRGVSHDFYAPELFRARSFIARILGPVPSELGELDPGWSSGRSTSAFGRNLTAFEKYGSRLDVTRSARRHATQFLRDCPHWGAAAIEADGPCSLLGRALNEVSGNVMLVVPKNAKTGRVICYEPHVNVRLQLAVGKRIRRRLAKAGVDLSDQSINQRRARWGSLTGLLATVDLRSASDTVALELVWELLPYDWACLLDDLRSKYTTWPDGTTRLNEKFSSMGNGFTFELESLIFFALAKSVTSDVTVYGDDVIVPTNRFEQVTNLFKWCGFEINTSKSFASSPFRESCGEDAFDGVRVTPPYVRSLPKRVSDVLELHNAVRASAHTLPLRSIAEMLARWRDVFPAHWGPSGFGDGHYHVDFSVYFQPAWRDRTGSYTGIEGYWFKTGSRVYPRFNPDGSDRLDGEFRHQDQFAALCVATGPKRAKSVWDTFVDRREFVWRTIRGCSGASWDSIDWRVSP
jgi:hypothetical protein